MSEKTELDEFLLDLQTEDYKDSTVEAFGDAGTAMVDAGITGVVGYLEAIKSAMRNEYGD